ncbi:MAG TPA: phage tail protein, partial [Nitrospirae bacterium]|nr:phage tail protein [Nitrospirota bacterium]
GEDKWRWNFSDAYPVKWTGPELRADNNTVAFETIELAHHGIKKG